MVFSSTIFLFLFLPIVLAGYFLLQKNYRNYWLLLVSLVFFSWSQLNYLWIIVLNITVNYSSAILISIYRKKKKILLAVAIVVNLGILFYFKYFDFTLKTMNKIFGSNIALRNIVLPIGISFFTFQGMSYVIDVYKEAVPVQKNIFKIALYIVLFPQLIAGPIVRYKDIAVEIDKRNTALDDFSYGIERFIIGLSKKAILANSLAVTADSIWGTLNNSCSIAWLGSIAYTLQIYFDFSGYSDMAIGIGRMLGFHFNENFDLPYVSKSITEFWRRWHISLSSWFRDYVYIPLGGNRKRVYFNLTVVFLLTGIWHGAAWHFIAWGIWNGCFILLERFCKSHITVEGKSVIKKNIGRDILLRLYTLSVIHFGWVIFRAPHLKDAFNYIETMFGLSKGTEIGYTIFWYLDKWTIIIILSAIFFSTSIPNKIAKFVQNHVSDMIRTIVRYIFLLFLLYLSMLRVVAGTYNPFIYFQF